jgi:hypothetical protein
MAMAIWTSAMLSFKRRSDRAGRRRRILPPGDAALIPIVDHTLGTGHGHS